MPNIPKSFIFCVHAHQPVGNFDNVFEDAFQRCYRPFIEVLNRHPKVPVSLHVSGCLLDWLSQKQPDFVQDLRRMGESGQIEFLGGAYYEPIYGLIPENDLTGQIRQMQEKIQQLFGQLPQGAWLTERVWDPHLVGPLTKEGIQYTVLDDTHLEKGGVRGPVIGHYRAQQGGGSLDLFASHKALRYLIPFRAPEDTLRYLHSIRAKKGEAVVFADDCEKFGLWPGTQDWVYGRQWLDRFFAALEKDESIRVCSFRDYRASHASRGTVKVPHSSYSEMMQWCGGRFDNFFSKYPESGYMKERMKHVSARLAKAPAHPRAQQALYRAQCNCSYWHGVFGGLYLHHLRATVYENLIEAEGCMDGTSPAEVIVERFDTGARWALHRKNVVAHFNPHYGAALEEFDYLPKPANLVCTLQRRPESYHALVGLHGRKHLRAGKVMPIHQLLGSKMKNLSEALQYDPFRRLCFMDHFFETPLNRQQFHDCTYKELGDFVSGAYQARESSQGRVCFERRGTLRLRGKKHALYVKKCASGLGDNGVHVEYTLKNEGRHDLEASFGTEFNFSIGASELHGGLDVRGVTQRTFKDSWRGLELRLSSDVEGGLLATPVETVSESEGGMEKTYQQLAVLFQRPLRLAPGESVSWALSLEAGESSDDH